MSDEHNINENNHGTGKNNSGEDGFKLPEGYFDSFSSKLFSRIESENELAEFRLLSSIPKKVPFEVPAHYFEQTELKAELSTYERLAAYSKVYAGETPENYFELFSERLRYRIELAEETKAFAALSALDKVNPFVVSEAYFDNLAQQVKDRIHAPGPSGVIGWIESVLFTKKLAYAFGLLLIAGLSVVYYLQPAKPAAALKGNCNGIACLDKGEIINSSYLKNLDEESLIELIDVNTLSDSLNSHNDKEATKEALDYVIENSDANNIIDEL